MRKHLSSGMQQRFFNIKAHHTTALGAGQLWLALAWRWRLSVSAWQRRSAGWQRPKRSLAALAESWRWHSGAGAAASCSSGIMALRALYASSA